MPLDEAERLLTLQLVLKCSDMGHTSADLPVHLQWVSGLEEEVRPRTACLVLLLFRVRIWPYGHGLGLEEEVHT